jgi:hypothetical protein
MQWLDSWSDVLLLADLMMGIPITVGIMHKYAITVFRTRANGHRIVTKHTTANSY